MPLYLFIMLPIVTALITYIFESKLTKLLLILSQSTMLFMAAFNFFTVRTEGSYYYMLGDFSVGVGIRLRADLFGSVMLFLTIFLFSSMLLYNFHKSYMSHLFLFLFLVLQGLICGLFLSNDLFNIYVLVEVSTIVVTILIVFKKDSKSIYDGMIYLFSNLTSMTLFLLGVGLLYKIFGTLDLTKIKELMPLVTDKKVLILPFVLLITSVDLKAAIMPLFSWLPKAHGTASAPSIISATLSGLYVKGGVYLFVRIVDMFSPVFSSTEVFLIFGFLTAVVGFIFALSQTDIKLILAYHTVSQIGLIVFGLSVGSVYSYWGSIYHILNHAVFKSTLFLTAGIIVDEYHTRDIRKIRGVMQRMPIVAIASILAILGITGAPLFNGSFSKYLIQKGAGDSFVFEIGFFIINLGTIMSFVKYSTIFRGKTEDRSPTRWNQSLVILTLGFICFLGGVFGSFFISFLFGIEVSISIDSYFHKFITYLLNVGMGIGFYYFLYHRIKLFKRIREIDLTFNEIIMSIILFMTGFLSYMMYQYG